MLSILGFVTVLSLGADPAVTVASTSNYQTAWLTLEKGGVGLDGKSAEPFDVPMFLGLRDGQATVAWFAHLAMAGGRIVWLDKATLKLAGTTFRGELIGRTNLNWGSKNVHDFVYKLEATVTDGKIAGSFTASFSGDEGDPIELSGKLSGRFPTVDQQATDKLPVDKNWPHYYGDGQSLSGPICGAKLLDDLRLARPVWKSEALVPTAYGSAPDSRYFDRAGRTDNGGGSSSPVVADGRVYQFFYYPRGPVGLDKPYGKYNDETDLAAKARELFPQREIQQRAVVNHFRTQADEVVVCLDAATGKTLWKTTLPQRGNNYQTHKHRGLFPVALVADGVVYQPGTTGRLYAIDAVTGKLRWEFPDANPEPYITKSGGIDCRAPSPVLVGDTVVFASGKGLVGVEAKTGQKKWQQPLSASGSLLAWKSPRRTLLLAVDRNHEKKENYSVAYDPADGSLVWRQPVDFLVDYTFPLLAGDTLVGYSPKLENIKPGENDGLAVLIAYKVSEQGLKKTWTTPPLAPTIDTVGLAIHGEHLYLSTAEETFCLSLANGTPIASAKNVGGARTQTAFVADGRLFIQPEGRHGRQSFFLLDADPKNFRLLGGTTNYAGVGHPVGADRQWLPPHSWTTAYANQPIVYPLIDGRLFVRGLDAIYCYDLRRTGK